MGITPKAGFSQSVTEYVSSMGASLVLLFYFVIIIVVSLTICAQVWASSEELGRSVYRRKLSSVKMEAGFRIHLKWKQDQVFMGGNCPVKGIALEEPIENTVKLKDGETRDKRAIQTVQKVGMTLACS